jgi:hypothetical protein
MSDEFEVTIQPDETLREIAQELRDLHNPWKQTGNDAFPNRCKLCNYTHLPCDQYWSACVILSLLDRIES